MLPDEQYQLNVCPHVKKIIQMRCLAPVTEACKENHSDALPRASDRNVYSFTESEGKPHECAVFLNVDGSA